MSTGTKVNSQPHFLPFSRVDCRDKRMSLVIVPRPPFIGLVICLRPGTKGGLGSACELHFAYSCMNLCRPIEGELLP